MIVCDASVGYYAFMGANSTQTQFVVPAEGNVFAALNMDNGRNRVVTVLPDSAERYCSTGLL
ncbi:MAG: hypothetical protein ACFE9C_17735 [Candidatus Hodarchaeota archaeon]